MTDSPTLEAKVSNFLNNVSHQAGTLQHSDIAEHSSRKIVCKARLAVVTMEQQKILKEYHYYRKEIF